MRKVVHFKIRRGSHAHVGQTSATAKRDMVAIRSDKRLEAAIAARSFMDHEELHGLSH
jgi:hypothetical protein